jgi:nitrate/nitrite-specific signal transduction histidine kinase
LLGMRERAKRMSGTLALDSEAGKGTQLTLRIPRKHSSGTNGAVKNKGLRI